jgi:hypothetical protein
MGRDEQSGFVSFSANQRKGAATVNRAADVMFTYQIELTVRGDARLAVPSLAHEFGGFAGPNTLTRVTLCEHPLGQGDGDVSLVLLETDSITDLARFLCDRAMSGGEMPRAIQINGRGWGRA